jgi:DNA-binding MarR family transcriptional regulator
MALRLTDADRLTPWKLFLHAHAAVMEALEEELVDELDLPLTWYEVLFRLADAPDGRMRMTDLARSLLLSKSGVTRLVDRMESAGLVERGVCASDRRGSFAVITTQGRALYRKAAPIHLRGIDRLFLDHLSRAEKGALVSALGKVLAARSTARPAQAS